LEVIDYDSENLDEFIAKDVNEVVNSTKQPPTTWLTF
jgi:hypothetical protein